MSATVYTIGIDIGTTAAKAGLYSDDGRIVRSAVVRYDHYFDSFGSEASGVWRLCRDPLIFWAAARDLLKQIRPVREDVRGLSVGGQGPTLLALDSRMRPVYPAMLWLDGFASSEAASLGARLGRPVPPSWFVPKAMWLLSHASSAFARTRWLVQPMDYIAWRLTGVLVTAVASSEIVPWSDDEIAAAELEAWLFPRLCVMGTSIGRVTAEASQDTGLPNGLEVFAGSPDFVEAILGTAAVKSGLVCNKAGTSDGLELCWDRRIDRPGIYCAPHPVAAGLWHSGVTIPSTGCSFMWLSRITGFSPADLTPLAEQSPPGSRGLVFHPGLAGETHTASGGMPGVLWGIRHSHDRSDLARAVMEGCACTLGRLLEIFRSEGAHPEQIRITGGQSRSNLWNQIKADVLGLDIATQESPEGEVLGAAMIAAFGSGIYEDLKTASLKMARPGEVFHPQEENREIYEQLSLSQTELYRAINSTVNI